MKRLVSKINGREFIIADGVGHQVCGIPVFTKQEVEEMRGKNYDRETLNQIFDTKLELGCTVEALRPLNKVNTTASQTREMAKRFSRQIRDELLQKGARTNEMKEIKKP